jgi:hypothetical protein
VADFGKVVYERHGIEIQRASWWRRYPSAIIVFDTYRQQGAGFSPAESAAISAVDLKYLIRIMPA